MLDGVCDKNVAGPALVANKILEFDPSVRDIVAVGRIDQLKSVKKDGISLKQDVSRLIREGVTSFEEAERMAG